MENKSYNLAINNGPNHLHGGLIGFDKKIWRYEVLESEDSCGVRFSCMSEDMEEGYPGNVQVKFQSIFLYMKFICALDNSRIFVK